MQVKKEEISFYQQIQVDLRREIQVKKAEVNFYR